MKKTAKRRVVVLVILLLSISIAFVAQQYSELRQPGLIVLLYHKVEQRDGGDKYTLRLSRFEEQIAYLRNQGYKTVLPREIVKSKFQHNPSKTIILSFDDGTVDHYNTVYPMLKKYGFKGIFFVISKYVGSPGSLNKKQIVEMAQNDMEIGSHSYSHPFLDEFDFKEINYELNKSKDDLEKICGKKVIAFAPPGGWFNDDVVKVAKDVGYTFLFSCEIGTNDLRTPPFVYKRIEVTGDMSINQFKRLLDPPQILSYKAMQSLKFFLRYLIGSNNYKKLASTL